MNLSGRLEERKVLLDVDFDRLIKGYPSESLSREEERRLGELPKNDPERFKLVTHNIRFLIWHAIKFARGHEIHDGNRLITALQDSMIRSAQSYEPGHNCKFISYAVRLMNFRALDEFAAQCTPLETGRWQKGRLYTNKYAPVLHSENRSDWDDDSPVHAEERRRARMGDCAVIPPDAEAEQNEQTRMLEDAIKTRLAHNPRGQEIIIRYFRLSGGEAETLQQIANDMGVTKERIRQIKDQCLAELRKDKRLKELL